MIKFGSRTDVIFPGPAQLTVKAGDRVKGGSSILARVGAAQNVTLSPEREHSEAVR
jgi:hypothetical protein